MKRGRRIDFPDMETPTSSRIATYLPSAAGLVVGAVIATSTSSFPRSFLSWSEVLGFAIERLFLVSLACVMVTATLSALMHGAGSLDQHLLALTSRAAVWLVPLALLIRSQSLWTAVFAAAFAILATPIFRNRDGSVPNPEESLLSSLRPDNIPLSSKFSPHNSVAAALVAHIGALAIAIAYSLAGALLIGAAFAVWSSRFPSTVLSPTARLSRNFRFQSQTLFVVVSAIVFTISALLPHLHGDRFGGLFGTSLRHRPHGQYAIATPGQYAQAKMIEESATSSSEGNTGIILWPVQQEHAKLVAPTPIDEKGIQTNGRNSNPLVIPFDGVYWFFKSPDSRPPKSSRQAEASPETVDIRSTDQRPLSIEAHDYLGSLIDLRCCSRIQIAIRNADRYPETVSLELVLINTTLPNHPSQSLGQTMVRSTRPWRIYDKPQPVNETLNFPIPASSSFHRFDEVRIVFRLDRARAEAGAKIAIDHFVLVPRGL